MKCNSKNFCKHIWSKRKPSGNFGLLLNGAVDLVTKNTKKYEVLCLLHLYLLIRLPFMNLRAPRAEEIPEQGRPSFGGGGSGLGTFIQNIHMSIGADGMHPEC